MSLGVVSEMEMVAPFSDPFSLFPFFGTLGNIVFGWFKYFSV